MSHLEPDLYWRQVWHHRLVTAISVEPNVHPSLDPGAQSDPTYCDEDTDGEPGSNHQCTQKTWCFACWGDEYNVIFIIFMGTNTKSEIVYSNCVVVFSG